MAEEPQEYVVGVGGVRVRKAHVQGFQAGRRWPRRFPAVACSPRLMLRAAWQMGVLPHTLPTGKTPRRGGGAVREEHRV